VLLRLTLFPYTTLFRSLAIIVGWPLLWMGLFCYLVGIFYSSGPRPLSSLPVGELFSGVTMGFMISLICVYINTFEVFQWEFSNILGIVIIALPNTMWIANLMLANKDRKRTRLKS